MRLPRSQLESIGFLFDNPNDLVKAIGAECSTPEAAEIDRLFRLGLPPVTSFPALSTMFGYNLGFVRSLVFKTEKHYRNFDIPKGSGSRNIQAPRVGLKAIQKWLSIHFQAAWRPRDCVFGFVPGRSHVDAAKRHVKARWVYSVDIENFFPSTSRLRVLHALKSLGYQSEDSLFILSKLLCYHGFLAQGAPTSPVISNIVLSDVDCALDKLAHDHNARFTRYADDIVFSGENSPDMAMLARVKATIINDSWKLSDRKQEFNQLPKRLKVHGLLVHNQEVRLTKGYRNRIRAFKHLSANGKIRAEDLARVAGHINYAEYVEPS